MDVAVSGPRFGASAVPSLKQFVRDVTKAVPSPKGGTVYEEWQKLNEPGAPPVLSPTDASADLRHQPAAPAQGELPVGDLGSGSDYSAFQQHLGVPSDDIGSSGAYGVYHSVFDNFFWFKKFADPDFLYEQEMARVFGLQALRMGNADVLPYDYEEYGKEIVAYIEMAKKKAESKLGRSALEMAALTAAAKRFQEAGTKILVEQKNPPRNPEALNQALRGAERALLLDQGLPRRPWFRHAIYAPGEYTGYAAVVIPGVNEALDKGDVEASKQEVAVLAGALERAAAELEGYH
jgi:N-acetylated-alpha-linked acidic dipeptidase